MTDTPRAWATHAPADYMMVFVGDSNGQHAVVNARFRGRDELYEVSRGLEGAEIGEKGEDLSVYCTLPGERDEVLTRLQTRARKAWIERGEISFVAVGDSEATSQDAANRRRKVDARVVLSWGGGAPRCYFFEGQCLRCGEFRGKIVVKPQGAMLLDTRQLSCRCTSVACRYCGEGRVRRPLSEHFDPERRSGHVPWFGYLVPCGNCQAAGRGPDIWMSS